MELTVWGETETEQATGQGVSKAWLPEQDCGIDASSRRESRFKSMEARVVVVQPRPGKTVTDDAIGACSSGRPPPPVFQILSAL